MPAIVLMGIFKVVRKFYYFGIYKYFEYYYTKYLPFIDKSPAAPFAFANKSLPL